MMAQGAHPLLVARRLPRTEVTEDCPCPATNMRALALTSYPKRELEVDVDAQAGHLHVQGMAGGLENAAVAARLRVAAMPRLHHTAAERQQQHSLAANVIRCCC